MTNAQQVTGAMKVIAAVAEAIRELKEVPSGHLYGNLMGMMTLDQYNQIIGTLQRAELVSQDGFHVLRWIGPTF